MSTDEYTTWPEGLRASHESRGMKFLHEQKMRTFSTNILRMNGVELLAAAARLHDEEIGISLMDIKNQDASHQAHRELKRHIHNFVTSAMTLVDHTRVMLSDLYGGQPIHEEILDRIKGGVGNSPVCKFVQDMRNYIVHKGLPNSEMYFEGNNLNGELVFKTGVRMKTSDLATWDGWKALSKVYLSASGDYVEIEEFTKGYLDEVNEFVDWLENRLTTHHADDLLKLRETQLLNQPVYSESNEVEVVETSKTFNRLGHDFLQRIDGVAVTLLHMVSKFELPSRDANDRGFVGHRPVIELSDEDGLKHLVVRTSDVYNDQVVLFVHEDGEGYGLYEKDFELLKDIFNDKDFIVWVSQRFDQEFVIDAFVAWSRDNWKVGPVGLFSEYLKEKIQHEVVLHEVFFPIAQFEVEADFDFGPVLITSLKREFFDRLDDGFGQVVDKEKIAACVLQLRSKYQGLAAVRITIEAHPMFVNNASYHIARDCVDLLRFFAPPSPYADSRTPIALMGNEYSPVQNMLALSTSGFISYEGVRPKFSTYWRLSERELQALLNKGVAKAGELLDAKNLNDFERSVRSAMILFGKGCTMESNADRLRYTLSAVEEIYLRHAQEHAESCIAKRVSDLVKFDDVTSEYLAKCISKAYFVKDDVEWSSPFVNDALAIATLGIYNAIAIGLNNVDRFSSKGDYITALRNAE